MVPSSEGSRLDPASPSIQVGGLPTPDVCWYLDGKAIRPDDYHKMLVCEKGMHSFIIEIVTVHHAGVYECVARNRAGESRFSMRLDVIGKNVLPSLLIGGKSFPEIKPAALSRLYLGGTELNPLFSL